MSAWKTTQNGTQRNRLYPLKKAAKNSDFAPTSGKCTYCSLRALACGRESSVYVRDSQAGASSAGFTERRHTLRLDRDATILFTPQAYITRLKAAHALFMYMD